MKLSHLILLTGCIFGGYLVYMYLSRRKINRYTTPGGQWVLKWDQPTGTPPFSYMYDIVDEGGKQIVNSSTTDTSLILDPTLFVSDAPPPTGVMSDKRYTATITPTNSVSAGNSDVLTFQIYDTPAIQMLENFVTEYTIYPTSGGGDIFGAYNQIATQMLLGLNDRVTVDNLKVSISCNGKIYYPIQTTASNPNANNEASQWTLVWATCNQSTGKCVPQVTFNTGDQVVFNLSASNPGGSFTWSYTYTVSAAPAQAPGDIKAQSVFIN